MKFLHTTLENILNIAFPAKCISCGKNGSDFCLECLAIVPTAERESAEWIYPLYDYRHPPIKNALWALKYNGKKKLAKIFAEILYDRMLEELSELAIMKNFKNPILIPVPLSSERRYERGYNQTELLCEEIMKINDLRSADAKALADKHGLSLQLLKNVLIKPKDTEHQARIRDRNIRLKNVVGSFAVKNTELLTKKNIILIDDITTTGATLSEAKKVLKQAGARKVIAFTVAH